MRFEGRGEEWGIEGRGEEWEIEGRGGQLRTETRVGEKAIALWRWLGQTQLTAVRNKNDSEAVRHDNNKNERNPNDIGLLVVSRLTCFFYI